MTKTLPVVPVSRLVGGVNRFAMEAGPNQCQDAIDVINDDGDLRRRDAFVSVATAAPFPLPDNLCAVAYESDGNYAELPHRAGNIGALGVSRFFIGCREQFDGALWSICKFLSLGTSFRKTIAVEYWNGAWTPLPFVLDSTFRISVGDQYGQSLAKTGTLSWHRSQLEGWSPLTLGALTARSDYFWIRVTHIRADTGEPVAIGTECELELLRPGVRAFLFAPVNGLFPVRIKGAERLIVGSDRRPPRGPERGAMIGEWLYRNSRTLPLHLWTKSFDGVLGTYEIPDHAVRGANAWESTGAGEEEYGDDNCVTVHGPIPADANGNPLPTDLIRDGYVPDGGALQSIATGNGSTTTHARVLVADASEHPEHEYEGCLIRCTERTTGPQIGETRQITRSFKEDPSTWALEVYPPFSAAPNTSNRFDIFMPSFGLRFEPQPHDELYIPSKDDETRLQILGYELSDAAAPFAPSADNYAELHGKPVHLDVLRELRHHVRAGRQWDGVVDPITEHGFFVNGDRLLEHDGNSLFVSLADYTSDRAKQLSGDLPDDVAEAQFATSKLRADPPRGAKFIVTYKGSLVLSGFEDRPRDIVYSFPGDNNIWPNGFVSKLFDASNLPITGMRVLYDRLVVFTAGAIFEGRHQDHGQIGLGLIAQGIGFVSHHAVETVAISGSAALVGPGPDGVYAYNGAEPVPIAGAEDWEKLIEGGVNKELLDRSVATVLRQRNLYILAVARAGSSELDCLLVWDWVRKAWWVWSAPFGVSSLATKQSETGTEELFLGTNDGHIMVLRDAPTDDGKAIFGRAKSPAIQPFGGAEADFVALLFTAKALGKTQTMDIRVFVDDEKKEIQAAPIPFTLGGASFGHSVFDRERFAREGYKTARFGVRNGTRGHQVQYEVSGTARFRLRQAEIEAVPRSNRGRP